MGRSAFFPEKKTLPFVDGVPYQVARIVMKACRHPAQARLFDPEFLKKISGLTDPVRRS